MDGVTSSPCKKGGLLRPSPDGRPGPELPALTCWHGLRNIRAADQDAGFATVRREHRLSVELNPTIEGRFLSEPTGETPTGCRFAMRSGRPQAPAGPSDAAGAAHGIRDLERPSARNDRGAGALAGSGSPVMWNAPAPGTTVGRVHLQGSGSL